jgi:hypothetical protein
MSTETNTRREERLAHQAANEIERLRSALVHIVTMDCLTGDEEELIHLLMMRIAQEALKEGAG